MAHSKFVVRCDVCHKNMISYECQRCGKKLCFNCVFEGSYCEDCFQDEDESP